MAHIIDLDTTQKALLHLATDQGEPALDYLSTVLEDFRNRIGIKLNDAEFKYVINALVSQRSTTTTATAATRRPDAAFNLKHGFVIKAKI
jgi:hypothetical protein